MTQPEYESQDLMGWRARGNKEGAGEGESQTAQAFTVS